ncbi:MAG: MFS transporter [Nanoarchaeota archaeon]
MVVFARKKQGHLIITSLSKLAFITLVVSLASAFTSTVWAVYIDSFVHNTSKVGFISATLTIVSFIAYFYFIPLIEKSDKSRLYATTLILFIISYILLAINRSFYIFLILAFIITIVTALRVTCFGIIIKDKSSKSKLSRNEGIIYTSMNFAFLIGPLIAGYFAEILGVNFIFLLAALLFALAFVAFKLSKIHDVNKKKKIDGNLRKNFIDYFKNKKRIIAYIIGGGINFWFVLIYVYMPLYILQNGFHEKWIGYFLFGAAIPAILFQYKLSEKAGKIGFKKIFKIGFLIPCIFSILCFFVSNFFLILIFIILGTVGISILEPISEAYFFDILRNKEEELRFYGPYNTTIDVNQFLGEVLPAALLLFLPFKFVFLFFGFIMFLIFLVSLGAKNVVEGKRSRRLSKTK